MENEGLERRWEWGICLIGKGKFEVWVRGKLKLGRGGGEENGKPGKGEGGGKNWRMENFRGFKL